MGRSSRRASCNAGVWAVTAAIALLLAVGFISAEDGLVVRRSPVTGLATSVTSADGGFIPVAATSKASRAPAMAFVTEHGHLFGINEPEWQLELERTRTDSLGHRHTRLRQVHEGVPVFSGLLAVHQDAVGRFVAANGDIYPIPKRLDTTPRIAADVAAHIALAHVAVDGASVTRNELVVVDPGWYGDRPAGAHLAHHVEVVNPTIGAAEAFFVDAHSGALLDSWSLVNLDRQRRVHDGQGRATLPGPLARSEGDPPAQPVGDPVADDINRAYDYMGDFYAYFASAHGRDSIDDMGIPLVATVNSTAIGASCPTAFFSWDLRQIVFCLGRVPDDVVAHELTHGLTHFTAALIYQNQSGSLNEHFSFAFGETVDLFNSGSEVAGQGNGPPPWSGHISGTGIDSPNTRRTACSRAPGYPDGVRWLYNEDRVQFEGAAYDYWDPTCFGHPDRGWSPLQTCPESNRGGTHLGAEVPNHAYALVTDGGTFNGHEVEGIGLVKAGAVWYRALTTYLTPASDFADASWAFTRAAADLVGTTPNDPRTGEPSGDMITAADAAQVETALRAVEMDGPGRCGQGVDVLLPDPAPECEGQSELLSESFDDGLPEGWTVSSVGGSVPVEWRVTGEPLPYLRPGRAAFGPDPQSSCLEGDESAVHRLDSPVIHLPEELRFPTLAFTHLVATEPLYDGGRVAVRVGGGDWQAVPAGAFYRNGYNQVLATPAQGSTNPLAGTPAFTGGGGRWGTSLLYLGGLVSGGDDLQIRFELGTDWCGGVRGWHVDDVRVYDCTEADDCDNDGVPDGVQTAGGTHPDVLVRHLSTHADGDISDADRPAALVNVVAERFTLMVPKALHTVRLWGCFRASSGPEGDFTVVVYREHPVTGLPGSVLFSQIRVPARHAPTGLRVRGVDEWEVTLSLEEAVSLEVGAYWVSVFADTSGSPGTFFWSHGDFESGLIHSAFAREAPGVTWYADGSSHYAIELEADMIGADCNGNSAPDACDIAAGLEPDDNGNGVPDRCEPQAPRRPAGRVGG